MKASIIGIMLFTCIVLSGCKKEASTNTGPSVYLTALTYFKDYHDETATDRSSAWSKTSFYSTADQNTKVVVDIGEQGTVNTQAIFGLSFTFINNNMPANIRGTYTFPASNQFIRVVLRYQIAPGRVERYLLPVFGKVSFTYDSAKNHISGRLEKIEFNTTGIYPFDRNKIIINGTFERISRK